MIFKLTILTKLMFQNPMSHPLDSFVYVDLRKGMYPKDGEYAMSLKF